MSKYTGRIGLNVIKKWLTGKFVTKNDLDNQERLIASAMGELDGQIRLLGRFTPEALTDLDKRIRLLNSENRLIGGQQTETSSEDGGRNVFTFTLKDGTTAAFVVLNGHKGDPGADGAPGKDGVDGQHGKDGRDGVDGTNGRDGYTPVKGVDYFDGQDGKDGKDGRDGVDGTNGRDGRDGTNGRDGAKGDPGENGSVTDVVMVGSGNVLTDMALDAYKNLVATKGLTATPQELHDLLDRLTAAALTDLEQRISRNSSGIQTANQTANDAKQAATNAAGAASSAETMALNAQTAATAAYTEASTAKNKADSAIGLATGYSFLWQGCKDGSRLKINDGTLCDAAMYVKRGYVDAQQINSDNVLCHVVTICQVNLPWAAIQKSLGSGINYQSGSLIGSLGADGLSFIFPADSPTDKINVLRNSIASLTVMSMSDATNLLKLDLQFEIACPNAKRLHDLFNANALMVFDFEIEH